MLRDVRDAHVRRSVDAVRGMRDSIGWGAPMRIHDRIDLAFAAWGRLVSRWPMWTLLGALCVTAVPGAWVGGVRFDNSTQSFLHHDDPARVAYEAFRQQFGQDELALIAVRPPQLFERVFLERLRELQHALEAEVPHLQDVTTLINARSTRGDGDELIVEDLFATWPSDDAALAALRDRALATPLYRNTLFSRHYTYTMVSVRPRVHVEPSSAEQVLGGFDDEEPQAAAALLSDEQTHDFLAAVQRVVARHDSPDFKLELVGGLVTNQHLNTMLEHDVTLFVIGAVILMAGILWVLFRSWLSV